MVRLLIIADDFTGALDTGVQFTKQGIPALVTTNTDISIKDLDEKIQVLVVDIESRHVDAQTAYRRVEQIVKKALENGIQNFYKKTDSTLRGNIGSELEALLNTVDVNQLIFVPAFPKSKRTTINGCHYVDGVPLHNTVFAQDPFEPVRHSFIPDIIKEQSDVKVEIIKRDDFNSFVGSKTEEKAICVFDSESNEDMLNIGKILKETNSLRVMAGCAGFAELLPELLDMDAHEMTFEGNSRGMLVVSGSINQISLNQINHAKQNGYMGVALTPEQKLDDNYVISNKCNDFLMYIQEQLKMDKKLVIEAIENRNQMEDTNNYAMKNNIPLDNIHLKIARNVGLLVKRILDFNFIDTLVVFGGDTLLGIMQSIECEGIMPTIEITSGVVASKVISDSYKLNIITKAGGLGGEDVITKIQDYVKAYNN
jgi:uncharacterized protein YgbK (DUF1537 family)